MGIKEIAVAYRQSTEAFDEFALNAQHAPGVRVDPIAGSAFVEQSLVRRGRLGVSTAAKYDGSLVFGRLFAADLFETTGTLDAVHGVQAIRRRGSSVEPV